MTISTIRIPDLLDGGQRPCHRVRRGSAARVHFFFILLSGFFD